MWLFTETGFISAVRHRDNANLVMVRARDEMSLFPLARLADVEIDFTPNADYAYRVVVDNNTLIEFMTDSIETMSYDNFKNQVTKTRGSSFVRPLHRVWEVMHQVEDDRAVTRYHDLEEDKYFEELKYGRH